jgi:hypothetical protein
LEWREIWDCFIGKFFEAIKEMTNLHSKKIYWPQMKEKKVWRINKRWDTKGQWSQWNEIAFSHRGACVFQSRWAIPSIKMKFNEMRSRFAKLDFLQCDLQFSFCSYINSFNEQKA